MSKTRIKYRFTLEFPTKPFTLKSLTSRGAHPQYITAYMRVKNALKSGTLIVVGRKIPTEPRHGRRELLYCRADAKVPTLSAAAV